MPILRLGGLNLLILLLPCKFLGIGALSPWFGFGRQTDFMTKHTRFTFLVFVQPVESLVRRLYSCCKFSYHNRLFGYCPMFDVRQIGIDGHGALIENE